MVSTPILDRVRRRGFSPVLPALLALLALPLLASCQQPAASETAPAPSAATSTVLGDGLAWLPVYPGAEVQPLVEQESDEGVSGTLSVVVPAEAREVVKFYRDGLEALEFRVRIAPFETPYGRGARISGHNQDETRGLNATVTPGESSTTVLINYTYASPVRASEASSGE